MSPLIKIEGRLMARRALGSTTQLEVESGDGKISININDNDLTSTGLKVLRLLEIGDMIGVEGTESGSQKVLCCHRLYILSKGVAPIPASRYASNSNHIFHSIRHFLDESLLVA